MHRDPDTPIEVLVDEHVLRLDGNVVEILHRSGTSFRAHVAHVAVEARPKRDDLMLHFGVEAARNTIVGGARVRVPVGRRDEVFALVAEARRRRDALGLRAP